ncbi:hypothetical protein B0H14DRAFT_2753821 [Mycena olivaceomarginata]|nr:hypothetical protein B0H14DRAFT_2753821 [Mycena olivaceomarginata]
MSQPDEEPSFFERERDRLTREITSDFDELLFSGMTKEYPTIAALWSSFYRLMQESGKEGEGEEQAPGASASEGKRDSAR